MQFEFTLGLACHRHHAGVVRPWAYFRKPDHVAAHEQLDAEQAGAAQVFRYLARDVPRPLERERRHRMRLP